MTARRHVRGAPRPAAYTAVMAHVRPGSGAGLSVLLCAALVLGLAWAGCRREENPYGYPEPGPNATRTIDIPGTGSAPPDDTPTDFDGDGYEDAAAVALGGDGSTVDRYGPVVVFHGGEDGLRPGERVVLPGGSRPKDLDGMTEGYDQHLLTGDLDRDGHTDLVVQHVWQGKRDRRTEVLWGGEDGLDQRPVPLVLPDGEKWQRRPFTPEAIGDFDGDGHLDLVDAGEHSDHDDGFPARIVYGPISRDGRARGFERLDGWGSTTALAADLDQDGRTDLLLASDYDEEYENFDRRPTPVQFFHGSPDGPVLDERLTLTISEHVDNTGGTGVALADVDGDGTMDLLSLGGVNGPSDQYLRGGRKWLHLRPTPLPEPLGEADLPVAAGDFTKDGVQEVVSKVRNKPLLRLTGAGAGKEPRRLRQVGPRTPGVPGDALPRSPWPLRVSVLDANHDGHQDLLVFDPLLKGKDGPLGGFWYVPGSDDGLAVERTRYFDHTALGAGMPQPYEG